MTAVARYVRCRGEAGGGGNIIRVARNGHTGQSPWPQMAWAKDEHHSPLSFQLSPPHLVRPRTEGWPTLYYSHSFTRPPCIAPSGRSGHFIHFTCTFVYTTSSSIHNFDERWEKAGFTRSFLSRGGLSLTSFSMAHTSLCSPTVGTVRFVFNQRRLIVPRSLTCNAYNRQPMPDWRL